MDLIMGTLKIKETRTELENMPNVPFTNKLLQYLYYFRVEIVKGGG